MNEINSKVNIIFYKRNEKIVYTSHIKCKCWPQITLCIHLPKEIHKMIEQVEVSSHLQIITYITHMEPWPPISLVFLHSMTLGLSMPMSLEFSLYYKRKLINENFFSFFSYYKRKRQTFEFPSLLIT